MPSLRPAPAARPVLPPQRRTRRPVVAGAALTVLALARILASTGDLQRPPVMAQRSTLTPRPTEPTATQAPPPASPTPAEVAPPPSGAGAQERGARHVFMPLVADANSGTNDCTAIVSVFNAGDTDIKPALAVWGRAVGDGPVSLDCGGLLRPGATWRFTVWHETSGAVFSFNMRSLTEVAPGLMKDDLVGDYLCESLYYGVVGNADAYRAFRSTLIDGGTFKGVPMDKAMGGPLAVSVERTCAVAGQTFTVAAEYGGTSYAESLTAWTPTLQRYRYALPDLRRPDASGAGPRSRVFIQNAGADAAAVELLVVDDNAECAPPRHAFGAVVTPGEAVSVAELPPGTTAGWVVGTQPLAVAVETTDAETLTAYEGAPSPPNAWLTGDDASGVVRHAPLAYVDDRGWSTRLDVQNESTTTVAKVRLTAYNDEGFVKAVDHVVICPDGHATVDVGTALHLENGLHHSLRVESQVWQPRTDNDAPPAPISAVLTFARRPEGSANDTEAGAYLVVGGPNGPVDGDTAMLVVPDVAATSAGTGPDAVSTDYDVSILNAVTLPGLTTFVTALGGPSGLLPRRTCDRFTERQLGWLTSRGNPPGIPSFRGAALVSATMWQHPVFDPSGARTRNAVGLAVVGIEWPVGSIEFDERPDADAPGDATRAQGGIPIRRALAAGHLVSRTVDGKRLDADCPSAPTDATPAAKPTATAAFAARLFLPAALRSSPWPVPIDTHPCPRPWILDLTAAADGGTEAEGGITRCNGRSDPSDVLATAGCPLPSFRAQVLRPDDGAVLWEGALEPDTTGRSAGLEAIICQPPPYLVRIVRAGDDAECWRACPGTPEVRSVTQADFDAADPGGGVDAGRVLALGWGYDRVAAVAASQGPPMVYAPVLNFRGEDDVCASTVTVQNAGATFGKAILITHGEPGFCPPQAAGPLKLECSGLIVPGASWTFMGAQVPTGSKSGYVVSVTARSLSEIGVDIGVDDIAADYLCEVLFFGIVGDPEDERRFRSAFLAGTTFQGLPMDRLYGGPLAVHVERDCLLSPPKAVPPITATDAYTALSQHTIDARPGDVAEYRYALPALVADTHTRTLVNIQNAGLGCAEVELRYRAGTGGGAASCARFSLAAGETRSVDVAACLAPNGPGAGLASPGVGWAIGTAPLAVVVDVTGAGDWPVLASYAAPPPPSTQASVLFAPLVLPSTPATARRARLFVQNLAPDNLARVHVGLRGHDGEPLLVAGAGLDIDPGAGVAIDLDVPLTASTLRVESYAPPLRPEAPPSPIAAALLQWRPAGEAGARAAVIDTLAPAGVRIGALDGMAVGGTRLAIPVIGKDQRGGPDNDDVRWARLAISNRVEKPGFTIPVVYLYDQNGLLDYLCFQLNERQTELIHFETLGAINNGFRGSALVSASFWEHDVPGADGHPMNLVDLDASFGWFGTGDGDGESLSHAVSLSPDVAWPAIQPTCPPGPGFRPHAASSRPAAPVLP